MNTTTEYNYASLMMRAEQAESRKEALYYIHAATRLREELGMKDHRQLVTR